ncbi:MAG: winged helix-turn-helix domain-containing protein [Micromonosporaceae bacterium]|nr:winged helix-turn-helix domain-containing protein [Micromonosporaceae bacterium]
MRGAPVDDPFTTSMTGNGIPAAHGLVRHRLVAHLAATRATGLALVVAPAGYGKTTLLAQYAHLHPGYVTWHGVDGAEAIAGQTDRLLGDIADSADHPESLLIIDNVDQLIGTPAEAELERALSYRSGRCGSSGCDVLLSGRRMPELNLLRHEVSGVPCVIGPDHLRFRTWEVERLLASIYAEPLPPDEIALLTRRTGGWAAGLAMFHLSTRGRPLAARQRTVASLSGRWSMARGYLARTLLADLDPAIRTFLVRTSVFEVLTGTRCDCLLDTTGSARVLDDLANRHGLLSSIDGGQSYLYHQVMRSHLAEALVEDLGERQAARWHARAARLLIDEAAYGEAIRAHARAGDWAAVRRLLARAGDVVVDHDDPGLGDLLPAWLLAEDPWLVYGEARRRLGHGQLHAAIDGFRKAESLFADEDGKRRCRARRRISAIWLADEVPGRAHWSAWLRAALRRHPLTVSCDAVALPGTSGHLVRLMATMLAGNLRDAYRYAMEAPIGCNTESSIAALALRLLRTGLRQAAGVDIGIELDRIADEAEAEGAPWFGRLARAAMALGSDSDAIDEAHAVASECEQRDDVWGALAATVITCLRDWHVGLPDAGRLSQVARAAKALGAGVVQAWAQSMLALSSSMAASPSGAGPQASGAGPLTSESRQSLITEAKTAAHLAASIGVPGAHILATLAIAHADAARSDTLIDDATVQALAIGMPLPPWVLPARTLPQQDQQQRRPADTPAGARTGGAWPERVPPESRGQGFQPTAASALQVSIRCFGGFQMEIAGRRIDIMAVRARARSALRLLATNAGHVVHKEVLIEALWPDLSATAATRNLQVTVSALRGLLEPASERGKAQLLIRSGEAYGLALPQAVSATPSPSQRRSTAGSASGGSKARRLRSTHFGRLSPRTPVLCYQRRDRQTGPSRLGSGSTGRRRQSPGLWPQWRCGRAISPKRSIQLGAA